MQSFANLWRSLLTRWKTSSNKIEERPHRAEVATAKDDPPSETCSHPDVCALHEVLDDIEKTTLPASQQSQRADDRRVVARNRRKAMERRAAAKDIADVDPDDTSEFLVAVKSA